MAVPAWATDLNTIDLDPTGTGSYAALGGGGAGLNAETDFYVQGGGSPTCASKDAWSGANMKGLCNDTDGIPWSVPTDGVLLLWGYYSSPPVLDSQSNGGLRLIAGSSASAYYEYYCGGNDTLTFETFVPYVLDPDTATADATTGSPTGTWNAWGLLANPPVAGPSKGAPIGIDALYYGRHTLRYTAGESADYNTFAKAEAYANDLSRRWGNIEFSKGVYYVQGFHSFGISGTAVDFRDSNKVLFLRACDYNLTNDAVTTGYIRFEVINAGSNVDWDNIIFQALGTRSLGTFVHTAGTLDANNCQFVNVGTFSLLSTSVFNGCVFRNTGIITAPGSDLQLSSVLAFEGTANTSPVVWDVATNPVGKLDGMTFEMGSNLTHAIEFGTTAPEAITLNNITFTGYDEVDDNQNDSTLHIKRTSGTTTISITGNGTAVADITYRSEGATVVLVQNVVVTFDEMKDNTEVRVYDSATGAELDGIENATAGTTDNRNFPATVQAGASVDYVIHAVDYENIRVEGFTWPSTAQTIVVQQRVDRNVDNP